MREPGPSTPRAQWSTIHDEQESWRKKLVGDISDTFIIPRYVRLFYDTFGEDRGLEVCEIGSGNGDISTAILAANKGQIHRYVTSEMFEEGVTWLRNLGLESVRAEAQSLPWTNGEFDAAVAFDVMHHVDDPRTMAREMMRAARGRLLLVESNGLSIFRRLRELTPGHRRAGERSYSPWGYRGFFVGHPGYAISDFDIAPFLFPFKCPGWMLPSLIAFNRLIEYVPILRWFSSSVWIRVSYRRVDG